MIVNLELLLGVLFFEWGKWWLMLMVVGEIVLVDVWWFDMLMG